MEKSTHLIFAIFGFMLAYKVEMIGGTDCYVCYSYRDAGCREDYVENVNLTTCGVNATKSPYWRGDRGGETYERERLSTCIKDVIVFINPPIRTQNDRYSRFNGPLVERKCGIPLLSAYRTGRDVDECVETEVIIEGVQGIKRSCSCSTHGCNTATSMKTNGAVLSLITIISLAKLLAFFY